MCAMQRNRFPNEQMNQAPPPPPPPRYRFRRSVYVGVPLAIGVYLWFISGLRPAFRFSDLMDALRVQATDRYTLLASLGVLCVTVLLIIRMLKNK